MDKMEQLRILYGVQATGQGHITRARSLGPALLKRGAKVDFLFSGRDKEKLFSMEEFGNFEARRGLTIHFNNGHISSYHTLMKNNILTWVKDVKGLDLSQYDLVITDYEPVTAWAAKLRKVPSLGIGHQYAFHHKIPMKGFTLPTLTAMKLFAPADTHLGMHWNHFNQPIIPPMVPSPDTSKGTIPKKIVVYLYFEDQDKLANIFRAFGDYTFYIYSPAIKSEFDSGNLKFRPVSSKFKEDVENSEGVICGAGFELPTEVIHLGKKLLVKPMRGQPEQSSNALAIEKLGLGMVMRNLDRDTISKWLENNSFSRISFPDTAEDVADWILKREWNTTESLIQGLWDKTLKLE